MVDQAGSRTVRGRYSFVPNPCTTQPCLPGMAYAVQTDDGCFFLTAGGRWSDRPRNWDGWSPQVGDVVVVTGQVHEHLDVRAEPFSTIEVESVAPGGS